MVGNGNVAMDLARILASPREVLAATDIAEHALDALGRTGIREIHVLGRRGPAQAAFTNKELKELGELPGVDVIVGPRGRRARRALGGRRRGARPTAPAIATSSCCASSPRGRSPGRPSGSCCTSWSRRSRSSAPSGSRPSRSSTTSSTRARTARSARARPSGAPPCRWAWSSGRSATRGSAAGHPLRRHARRHPERRRAHHRPAHRRAGAGRVRGRMDQARAAGDHRDQQARLPGDGQTPPRRPRPGPSPQDRGPLPRCARAPARASGAATSSPTRTGS